MEKLLIIDFGSQFTQLIATRVREINIYCDIFPYNNLPELDDYKAIILSGSPHSVRQDDAPTIDLEKVTSHAKVLGICYGAQYIAQHFGGEVHQSNTREYGRAILKPTSSDHNLLQDVSDFQVWMSHSDTIGKLPKDYHTIATTEDIPYAAYRNEDSTIFGIQFHPEVYHSTQGIVILKNFLVDECGFTQDWTPSHFIDDTVAAIQKQVKDEHVILGLSGGVDSTVAALLISKAIGDQLTCIFVNNGLLRYNEYHDVLKQYESLGLNIRGVDASDLFLKELQGVSDPEQKRKIIGRLFIDVFSDEAKKIKDAKWLGQGTIYPDVIESVSVNGPSATIKSHHNVGGLPEEMNLQLVEPLRMLFKDEVRRVGKTLGLADSFVGRHPFPGPGLAIRIIGDITAEKVELLQKVDHIYIEKLKEYGLYDKIWQAGSILLPIQSVGVMGDERTYERVVALRAVESKDGMTADWVHIPYEVLADISNSIINKVSGINRVVYDISSKPPATIEWE